jgi:CRISPR-associated exonuclease Cas4
MARILLIALVLALLGLRVVVLARRGRGERGLSPGETLALDDTALHSERHKLVGRPDRIVREGEFFIPEEWKSSKRVNDGHRLQLGAYFILVEEEYGVRPPHGVVVLGDGTRVVVRNTESLRSKVLEVADQIRRHRQRIEEEVPVRQPAAKCQACGQRGNCRQSMA